MKKKNPLHEGYEWSSCDIEELYEFLKENYIRDDLFELHYSKELIKWAIQPPGYREHKFMEGTGHNSI